MASGAWNLLVSIARGGLVAYPLSKSAKEGTRPLGRRYKASNPPFSKDSSNQIISKYFIPYGKNNNSSPTFRKVTRVKYLTREKVYTQAR